MAYVNFYKGLAADYVAETHQDDIYQCTDTGDTYIFGVKNSNSGGDGAIILDWVTDLAGGKGTISNNAYDLFNNFITSQDVKTPVFVKAVGAADTQATPEPDGLSIDLIPVEVYIVGATTLYISLSTKLNISRETFPTPGLFSDIHNISKINFQISMGDKSIALSTVGNLDFKTTEDGTKFLADNGQYVTPSFDTSNLATKQELTEGLAGKADTVHTHTASQVTDLATVATSGSYNDLSNKPSIPTIPGVATSSSNGLMSSTDKAKLDRMESVATRSNLSSVPLAANQIIVASLSANATLSLTGTLGNGQDTHIFVRNTSSSAITITMPSSSTYTNAQDSIEIPGKGYGEINIMRAGGYYFVRAAASE